MRMRAAQDSMQMSKVIIGLTTNLRVPSTRDLMISCLTEAVHLVLMGSPASQRIAFTSATGFSKNREAMAFRLRLAINYSSFYLVTSRQQELLIRLAFMWYAASPQRPQSFKQVSTYHMLRKSMYLPD